MCNKYTLTTEVDGAVYSRAYYGYPKRLAISEFKKYVKGKLSSNNEIEIDVRSAESLYVTIGDWVVYIDNSTGEKIIDSFKKNDHE